jgi:hypothetical protein
MLVSRPVFDGLGLALEYAGLGLGLGLSPSGLGLGLGLGPSGLGLGRPGLDNITVYRSLKHF